MIRSASRLLTATLLIAAGPVAAMPGKDPAPPPLPPVSKNCVVPGTSNVALAPLPNSRAAIQKHLQMRILAIGAPSIAGSGPDSEGYQEQLERNIEAATKGVRVQIINRGVSYELASDAAWRLKNEAGLSAPDLVLWQVGTSDAMARVSVNDFEQTLTETVRWLKERNIDVILVGARYAKLLTRDGHYQDLRRTVSRVAKAENVPRISQYMASEAIEKARGGPLDQTASSYYDEEAAYCVAEYVAQAVISTLFSAAPPQP